MATIVAEFSECRRKRRQIVAVSGDYSSHCGQGFNVSFQCSELRHYLLYSYSRSPQLGHCVVCSVCYYLPSLSRQQCHKQPRDEG